MASLTFEDIYNRKIDDKVISEINRRKRIYSKGIKGSSSALTDEEYRWLYRKTAYLTLKSLDSYESAVIYDINFGKPKMDIIYNSDPAGSSESSTGFRDVRAQVGRDVIVNEQTTNTPIAYSTLLGPITAPLLDLYSIEKGFIASTLVEASIETYADRGLSFNEKFNVKFIVHDKDKVSYYLEKIMRPLTSIELGFGWTTEDNDPNRGFVRGIVVNFSFSANNDGSWNCSIEGFTNPQLADGVPLNSTTVSTDLTTVKGRRNDILPVYADNTRVRTASDSEVDFKVSTANLIYVNGGLGSVLSNLKDNTQLFFDSGKTEEPFNPYNIQTLTGYYLIDISLGQFVTPFGLPNSRIFNLTKKVPVPRAYIRLDALIHVMNCILAYNLRLQKDTPMTIVIDQDISTFTGADKIVMKTGPADFLKFAFPYSNIGRSTASFPIIPEFNANILYDQYYLGAILLNVEYVLLEFLAATSNFKTDPEKTVQSFQMFLNSLFKQLSVETGGMIHAACFSTDSEIIIKDINNIQSNAPQKDTILELTAFTTNSVCREASIESEVSNEILTVASVASNTETSIGRSLFNSVILTENGEVVTLEQWNSYTEIEKNAIRAKSKNLKNIEGNLKSEYARRPSTILKLIKLYNDNYIGIYEGINSDISGPRNVEYNKNGQYLDDILKEPFPTSHQVYVMKIQELYRFIYQEARQSVLEGDNSAWKTIFNLRTATFPIKLKLKLDGIHGFRFGNYITTNWLPKGYSSKNCYFQVIKVGHTISSNDWYTELEAMYRIIL